jgi:hypothetical protein
VRSLSESQITPRFTSLAQFVCIRFPKTFAELTHDLEDAASYQITQNDPTLYGRELKKKISEKIKESPQTHFDLFREAHKNRINVSNSSLREGVWEGVGNNDYVDGLLFFYVTDSAKKHASDLKSQYDNPPSDNEQAKKFKKNHPKLEGFFAAQIDYFTKYSGHFVAFARCLEVYYAASGLNDKNPNRYYSRFDLDKFYELVKPIKREEFESSLNNHQISSLLMTDFLRGYGAPCFFPAKQAQHLLNMIAHQNRDDFIEKDRIIHFGNWLQNYTIVDESKYSAITDKNWAERQRTFDFDHTAREDQDIRAYFANYFVSDLAEIHKNNPDTNLVYRERRLFRKDQYVKGIADYVIQISNTSSQYWLPVEVKIDIANPINRNILEQVKKYTYCNSFINPHNGDPKIIDETHGVVLIIDKNGVYVTNNGEFVQECGINKPKWKRKELSGLVDGVHTIIDDIRAKLITTIQQSIKDEKRHIIAAMQPLRPYAGGNADLMHNVASLADAFSELSKTSCPIETLCLCTPVGDNVYFTRIDDIWFPVHINYTGAPTAIDYKKHTYVKEFKAPSNHIPIRQTHGISLVASPQRLEIMYTDENGTTTTLHNKIIINTPDAHAQARQTILDYYKIKQQASTN